MIGPLFGRSTELSSLFEKVSNEPQLGLFYLATVFHAVGKQPLKTHPNQMWISSSNGNLFPTLQHEWFSNKAEAKSTMQKQGP